MIEWIRVHEDLIAISYTHKDGMSTALVIDRESCRNRNYIENLGAVTDRIAEDVGRPLSREEIYFIARNCRETLLGWSK